MVDTTTQTPRNDDVTENNDSRDTGEEVDTTGYTEEHKEDIDGAESTKDSGIHQDEDGYDASYADEEFEEDEGQSDVEKGRETTECLFVYLFVCLFFLTKFLWLVFPQMMTAQGMKTRKEARWMNKRKHQEKSKIKLMTSLKKSTTRQKGRLVL